MPDDMPPVIPLTLRALSTYVMVLERRVARLERHDKNLIRCVKALWGILGAPLGVLLVQYFFGK